LHKITLSISCRISLFSDCFFSLAGYRQEIDEEQQKHHEELVSWKTEAKAAQDKVCIEDITRRREDMNCILEWQKQYFANEWRE